ncbi:ATP-binding protein [Sphingobacterium bovistauri]|uniref:histidine kinase n=1 Tax=Sphingobacterium bovistauri TaxID=2781959 RepID=A0ABS7Z6R0_9SPHI|nr:tetratricopeptide repeat-containing sensor histidine kinase [Sphingobacterium bovistauri]MCA5005827.1 tetratricopeptide repeat-containing sensor histidine kinase [Sphingobacterium bovistauri]
MNITLIRFIVVFIFIIFSNFTKGQSLKISEERKKLSSIRDKYQLIDQMNKVGILYQFKNIDSCLYYGLEAKKLSITLKYTKGELDAENLIALSLSARGLHKEALQHYTTILNGYRKIGDKENVVQILNNMALSYMDLNDNNNAEKFIQRAISLGDELERDSIMSIVYINYASMLQGLNKDSAAYYLNKTEEIANKYDSRGIILLKKQLEAYDLIQKNDVNALKLLEETISESKELDYDLITVNSIVLSGKFHHNNPKLALKYYKQAYDTAISTGGKSNLVVYLNMILETAEKLQDREEILNTQKLLSSTLMQQNENLKNFIGDYVQYNSLETDNMRLELSNNEQKVKIWGLIAFILIGILFGLYIYRQYKETSRLNKKIAEQYIGLQNTLSSLEESQEENKRLMKIVAHDLRNPLGAIKMAATIIGEQNFENPEHKTMLDLISQSSDQSLELVNNLLSSNTKIDDLKKENLDLQVILKYCVDLLQHKAVIKKQKIVLKSFSVTLHANREKLWRVISNLIANAIKFSPIGATIEVVTQKTENHITIAVNDNGIGIPEEMQSKIFQLYTEAQQFGTEGEQPYGLGLAISKQIVESHGGKIWFESKRGIGTTFWIEFPFNNFTYSS